MLSTLSSTLPEISSSLEKNKYCDKANIYSIFQDQYADRNCLIRMDDSTFAAANKLVAPCYMIIWNLEVIDYDICIIILNTK